MNRAADIDRRHPDDYLDDSPVVGNFRHPLVVGLHRFRLPYESKIDIASIVPHDEFWSSLYAMYSDEFRDGVIHVDIEDFVYVVTTTYYDQLESGNNHKIWSRWLVLSWINAFHNWIEPEHPDYIAMDYWIGNKRLDYNGLEHIA